MSKAERMERIFGMSPDARPRRTNREMRSMRSRTGEEHQMKAASFVVRSEALPAWHAFGGTLTRLTSEGHTTPCLADPHRS